MSVSDEYEKNRAFGKPEGIEKRLAMWGKQLSMDKSYPWVGLGLIDDIRCACKMLGGNPDMWYDGVKPQPKKPEQKLETAPKEETVYDL